MRPSSGHSLKGGVTRAARPWARKLPKRQSESTNSVAHRPRPSNGRSAGATAGSVMHAELAVHPERPEGKVARVEVVLQIEDAREARAVPERVLPGAVRPLRAQQVADAVVDRRSRRVAGGEERQQRPRGLTGDRRPAPGQLGLDVALAGLA